MSKPDRSPTGEHVTLDESTTTDDIVDVEEIELSTLDEPAMRTAAIKLLEQELGYRIRPHLLHLIDICPDPWVAGMLYVRFRNLADAAPDFFRVSADCVEQIELNCWPPSLYANPEEVLS